MNRFHFKAVRATQAPNHDVFVFAATPEQVLSFSEIERVGRNEGGELKGFQRHQIASHIKEIRDYLGREDALLPNAVIVAFIDGATVQDIGGGIVDVVIDADGRKPGFIVDGQQRLTALSGIRKPNFQVFVSVLICKDYNELRQQFVLINNTRPLPKTLIYELLPSVEGLPHRFHSRKFSAHIVDRLNHASGSSLLMAIRQHTNPKGVLSDTAMQKIVMNSVSDGAIRTFVKEGDFEDRAFNLLNEYFEAIQTVFDAEWVGMSPKTSRLTHGAGLVAMGFVMELLHSYNGATTATEFIPGLEILKEHTAWTKGQWQFSEDDIRAWNGIQNTPSDIDLLANYLVRSLKRSLRKPLRVANG